MRVELTKGEVESIKNSLATHVALLQQGLSPAAPNSPANRDRMLLYDKLDELKPDNVPGEGMMEKTMRLEPLAQKLTDALENLDTKILGDYGDGIISGDLVKKTILNTLIKENA